MPDPRYVRVEVLVLPETVRRYRYKAARLGKDAKRLMAEELDDAAQFLPAQPPPADASWLQARRHESRARNGGVSPYTAAIPIIPTRKDQP